MNINEKIFKNAVLTASKAITVNEAILLFHDALKVAVLYLLF